MEKSQYPPETEPQHIDFSEEHQESNLAINASEANQTDEILSDERPISPIDLFKRNLQYMVGKIEQNGLSPLEQLLAIKAELRARRSELHRQSIELEQQLKGVTYDKNNDLWKKYLWIREELLNIYHQLMWVHGYIDDRQK